MRGGSPDNFEYIGGVYIGDLWKEDIGEAVFLILVISDGLKKDDDKILFERVRGFIKK